MLMNVKSLIQANSIDDLKKVGSYQEIKKELENEIGNKIGGRSWESLFIKIKLLKKVCSSQEKEILDISKDLVLFDANKKISKILEINFMAKNNKDLEIKLKKIISFFSTPYFDPYDYYEKTKKNKFKNSSKLEGIDIPNVTSSLASILQKHQR